jgi:hypothetical protein
MKAPEPGSAMELNQLRAQAEAAGDPCYDCGCCAKWAMALELTAASARAHVAGELRLEACSPDCVICQIGGKA